MRKNASVLHSRAAYRKHDLLDYLAFDHMSDYNFVVYEISSRG